MRLISAIILLAVTSVALADTMDHYMNITNQIPQMQMKPDAQSQAWARSAQSVLVIANESIAETLMQANELAKGQGTRLFCLTPGVVLDANMVNQIILQTYKENSGQPSDKDKMTVSQVALQGIMKVYPCLGTVNNTNKGTKKIGALMGLTVKSAPSPMQHVSGER